MEDSTCGEKLRQCWHRGRDDSQIRLDDTCGVITLDWNDRKGSLTRTQTPMRRTRGDLQCEDAQSRRLSEREILDLRYLAVVRCDLVLWVRMDT